MKTKLDAKNDQVLNIQLKNKSSYNGSKPERPRLSWKNDPNATHFVENQVCMRNLFCYDHFAKQAKFKKKR